MNITNFITQYANVELTKEEQALLTFIKDSQIFNADKQYIDSTGRIHNKHWAGRLVYKCVSCAIFTNFVQRLVGIDLERTHHTIQNQITIIKRTESNLTPDLRQLLAAQAQQAFITALKRIEDRRKEHGKNEPLAITRKMLREIKGRTVTAPTIEDDEIPTADLFEELANTPSLSLQASKSTNKRSNDESSASSSSEESDNSDGEYTEISSKNLRVNKHLSTVNTNLATPPTTPGGTPRRSSRLSEKKSILSHSNTIAALPSARNTPSKLPLKTFSKLQSTPSKPKVN